MRPARRAWAGVACGLALGLGGGAVIDIATEGANAQASKVEVTSAQLLINQRISQAAVRRSNRALNYLAPIRTAQSDAADDGRKGVIALKDIPGAGDGWTTEQIDNGAVTSPKLGADAVTSEKIAPGGVGSGDLSDGAVTSPKIAAGAVGTQQIAGDAVGSNQIAPGAVGSNDLAGGAVTGPKLASRSVGPDALDTPSAASLFGSATAQSGISTAIPFVAPADPRFQTADFFDAATPTDVRIPRPGIYRLDVTTSFGFSPFASAGIREVSLFQFTPAPSVAVRELAGVAVPAAAPKTTIGGGVLINAGEGDQIRIAGLQNSGTNLTVTALLDISYIGAPPAP